jgi:hypothetical protein
MAGIKKVLNWFVTIETDETQPAPPAAASANPDEAAQAAKQQAARGPVGKPPEQPRRVGQVQAGGGKTLEEEMAELDAQIARERGEAPQASAPSSTRPMQAAPPVRPSARPTFDDLDLSEDAELDADAEEGAGEPRQHSFDALYKAAQLPGPEAPDFSVYKIERLLESEHLQGLRNDMKRASLLVAMQASNVKVDSVIADASKRDQILDSYDNNLALELDELEQQVTLQNEELEAEAKAVLERLQEQIAANNKQLADARSSYKSWKRAKKTEEQRLYNAIALFIAPGADNPVTLDD